MARTERGCSTENETPNLTKTREINDCRVLMLFRLRDFTSADFRVCCHLATTGFVSHGKHSSCHLRSEIGSTAEPSKPSS
jgi:hypothetical protein